MTVNPLYHQSTSKLEEEFEWIRKAQKDPEFFGPLYKKYYEQIFRYIHQRMDDEEQAFDITSQVFVKALKNLPTYEYRGVPLASWLYRIAKSEVYQAFRNRKAIRTVNVDSVQLIDMMHDMEEEEQEERREKLYLCLKKMNESDMQLIEMRYFEKRSFKEVGEILEITENNAKVKCFRALEKLKRFYTE